MKFNLCIGATIETIHTFNLRSLKIVSALLIFHSGHASSQNTNEPHQSSSVVAKPLWALTPTKLVEPLQGDFAVWSLGSNPDGNLLLKITDSGDWTKPPVFVVVDPKSGKQIRRIVTAAKPKDTGEWTSESKWLPDGRFLHVGVTRGILKNEGEKGAMAQGKVSVGISIRIINTANGSVLERLVPFDDPSGEGMSKGFCSWSAQVCVDSKIWGNRLMMSSPYFVAEFDANSLKLVRSFVSPAFDGFNTPGNYLLKNGRLWDIQRNEGEKYFLKEFEKQLQEVSAEEMKRISKDQGIEELAHPKTKEAKFFARENGVGKDLIHQEGAKLLITYTDSKTMEVFLGASNADSTVSLQQVGNLFLIHVMAKNSEKGKHNYRGIMAVALPVD